MSISTVVFRFLDTPYFSTNELSTISERTKLESNNFSILHINIRSIRKNFDAFESFLSSSACRFKALRITETWCDKSSCKSSLFNIPNYKSVQQYRSIKKKVVDVVYSYTISKILCCVRISIRIIIKKSKDNILSTIHRPPDGEAKAVATFFTRPFQPAFTCSK